MDKEAEKERERERERERGGQCSLAGSGVSGHSPPPSPFCLRLAAPPSPRLRPVLPLALLSSIILGSEVLLSRTPPACTLTCP